MQAVAQAESLVKNPPFEPQPPPQRPWQPYSDPVSGCMPHISPPSVRATKQFPSLSLNLAAKDFGPTRAAFFEYLTNGFYSRCSPDFYNLTGRRPTRYKDYLLRKGAAGETGLEELYQANLWKKGTDAMKEAVAHTSR